MNLTLESDRLILRVLFEQHAPLTAEFYRRNWAFLAGWEPNMSSQNADLMTQQSSLHYEFEQLKLGRFIRYWYAPKERPDFLYGTVCFQNILPRPFSRCEIGYKQDRNHQGNGYATEAVGTAIRHLFTEGGLHRIEALAECQNLSSLRLLERLGFEREGVCRQSVYLRNGWQDCYRYALLNPV